MGGNIEMSSRDGVVMRNMEAGSMPQTDDDEAPEPLAWARTRVRRQNRCFVVAAAVFLITAAVYVIGGLDMSQENSLVDKYEAQSGVVENDFDNAKATEAFENAAQQAAGTSGHATGHGKPNPFGNKNFPKQGVEQSILDRHNSTTPHDSAMARWNRTHPGQPYPSNDQFSPNHNKTHPANGNNKDGTDANCEERLSHWNDWMDKKITKEDGKQFEVLEQLEHDSKAFTQGLTYANGHLYESTGLYGKSTVRILDPDTAKVIKKVSMESALFGEGMAYINDELIQITWKSRQGFVYDPDTLEVKKNYTYQTTLNEGWGITFDECRNEIIVTDGSQKLHFWDPKTFRQKRKIDVKRMSGEPAKELNEIEFWRGRILANVWYEDVILVINPVTGVVEKEYDFSMLWPNSERKTAHADVLNGISVSEDPDVLYVTGKLWNRIFKLRLL